jgi:exopolyphosphatase/guanosine-5'-triphosphate,3'-diphosphate pyrophosphatase
MTASSESVIASVDRTDASSNSAALTFAAIDLGSNSFHMIVAREDAGRIQIVDRMREMVRLAEGLDEGNRISPEAMERGIACLERFGERVKGLPASNVRVVGTNTLRLAANGGQFIYRAQRALGHEVDVIAGHEEARLIYLGVCHALEDDNAWRLVFDIGGGSTEVILGRHFQPSEMDSLHMGCVSLSQRFFADGRIDENSLRRAELAALQEFEPIVELYRRRGWDTAIGSSGTVTAVRDIVHELGLASEGIPRTSLAPLREAMVSAGSIDALDLKGLQRQRAPVFPGGYAVLSAAFEAFGLEHMRVAKGALREGCLHDLLGRFHQDDIREHTVAELMRRYQIDQEQTTAVEETALSLLAAVAYSWQLISDRDRLILRWAARLHEIGLAISHSQYHKHGAYLVLNLDMPGFSRAEQRLLAMVIRSHRRKFPLAEFQQLHEEFRPRAINLAGLFRIAVLLHRARTAVPSPDVEAGVKPHKLKLVFPPGWLDAHALTRADLEQEAAYLKGAGIKLRFK